MLLSKITLDLNCQNIQDMKKLPSQEQINAIFNSIKKSVYNGFSVTESCKMSGVDRTWTSRYFSLEQKRQIKETKLLFSSGSNFKYKVDTGREIY